MGKMSPPKLFGDDDDEFPHDEGFSGFEIDEAYGRRLEHNRKREDLQRCEELEKRGVIVDDDDEESETDDDVGDAKAECEFFNVLNMVKTQNPLIRNKDVKFFESDEEDEDEDGDKKKDLKKDKKKMYLKDVQAKHLLEGGPDYAEEDSIGEKSYVQKQEQLKKELCDAVEAAGAESDEDDDDLFKVKESKGEDDLKEGEEELVKKLDEYFGEEAKVDEKTKYLRDFFAKKMWEEKDEKAKTIMIDDAELDELEEDEDLVEMQEEYEFNYRHEEIQGEDDTVLGQSRNVEGSVRKKDTARKGQRKSKEERMKMAELERQEELKQLKNIKKREIKEKMKKVLVVAGFKDGDECRLDSRDLDDDFNPEEYDSMMKKVFDDKYYGEEDLDLNSDEDCEKPDFDKEDELLGLPKDWEVTQGGDGFKTARELALKHKGNDADDEEEEVEEEEEEEKEEGKRKRKRKTSLVQKAKEALMEEYYKLDYEDTIGDLKTRFKYAKVQPNKFELETEEILCLEDTDLNQYVPLKKIAPYQEKDWEVNKHKVKEQKLKNRELLMQVSDKHHEKKSKKKRRSEVVDVVTTKPAPAPAPTDEEGETSKLSRKAKRRRRQAEKKLPPNRMAAYGKAQ